MAESGLRVSECFYSLQGEGATMGVPAVFLRLSGCNLSCGGLDTITTGELDNGASWRCDTMETWLNGQGYSSEALLVDWEEKGYLNAIERGAHLILTGGEPLLQDAALRAFLSALCSRLSQRPYVEMETNGTIIPSDALDELVSQYNVSPKLSNSGMPESKRVIAAALQWFHANEKSLFKVLLDSDSDWEELNETLLMPFAIERKRVYAMPACDSREALMQKGEWLAALCIREGICFSNRLQLQLWDKTVGV